MRHHREGSFSPDEDWDQSIRRTRAQTLPDSILSPWHVYKQDFMKMNLQTERFAADARRMLNGARLSVNGVFSIVGKDWLKAAEIKFSCRTALR